MRFFKGSDEYGDYTQKFRDLRFYWQPKRWRNLKLFGYRNDWVEDCYRTHTLDLYYFNIHWDIRE